jgi:hypothetical protein
MVLLAAVCVAIGLLAPLAVPMLARAIDPLLHAPAAQAQLELARVTEGLARVSAVAVGFLALLAAFAGLRLLLLRGRQATQSVTWDCGYASPAPRMQYTGSSFAQPLTELFRVVLRTRKEVMRPVGLFPREASFATHTGDVCSESVYRPVFAGIGRGLSRLRWLQQGRVQLYVLYITLTLLVLLVWKLG